MLLKNHEQAHNTYNTNIDTDKQRHQLNNTDVSALVIYACQHTNSE